FEDDDKTPAQWQIKVQDNGIGFEEKYREKIFEVFQRLHGRSEYEGSGIGLSIVRKIVSRHGGTINAHGLPGEGATFEITIPEKQPEAKTSAARAVAAHTETATVAEPSASNSKSPKPAAVVNAGA